MASDTVMGESGMFAPRRVVGRRPPGQTAFDQLEMLRQFAREVRRGKPTFPRQDYFPVLKAVGRNRATEVDFTVVGGVAVCLNDYVRFTEDADILTSERPETVRRLLEVLTRWGEGWARELKVEEFAPQEGSIRVMEEFDLDIFTRMRGKSLDDFHQTLTYRRGMPS